MDRESRAFLMETLSKEFLNKGGLMGWELINGKTGSHTKDSSNKVLEKEKESSESQALYTKAIL